MDASPRGLDVAEADFDREVVERSTTTPVVVDFWAPWCGPCRTLGPILERLAEEHAGAVVLAKVNVDEAPNLAARYRVQSIPAVKGFRDGELVAEFVGAQPESVVREFLTSLLPTDADRLVTDAVDLPAADAEARLREALDLEPRHERALLQLARRLSERGADADALDLLGRVLPHGPVAAEADRLAAILRTRLEGAGDEAALRARVGADPDDLRSRLDLGRALAARGRYEAALDELLDVVRRDVDFDDQAARKTMLDIFEVLGPHDMLTQRFRSALAQLLFR
jgi:putative thioredoxin